MDDVPAHFDVKITPGSRFLESTRLISLSITLPDFTTFRPSHIIRGPEFMYSVGPSDRCNAASTAPQNELHGNQSEALLLEVLDDFSHEFMGLIAMKVRSPLAAMTLTDEMGRYFEAHPVDGETNRSKKSSIFMVLFIIFAP